MKIEEAIAHLKVLKLGIGYLNSLASEKDKDLVDIEAIDIVLKELDNRIPKEKIANTLRRVQDYDLTYKDIALFNIISQELLGNEKWVDKE